MNEFIKYAKIGLKKNQNLKISAMSKMNLIIFMSVLMLSHGIGTANKRTDKCSENVWT